MKPKSFWKTYGKTILLKTIGIGFIFVAFITHDWGGVYFSQPEFVGEIMGAFTWPFIVIFLYYKYKYAKK